MPVRGDLRLRLAALVFPAFLVLPQPAARAADDRSTATVPGETRATASRLGEADRLFAEKKWSEGLDELQAVLDSAGDDLVPVDATQSVRARRLVHERIAHLPPEGLQRYRGRADVRARRWLDQGTATRDASLLRKVVEESFCSRPAERALELLGDLAFERGRFAEAVAWWKLLAPPFDAPAAADRLAYPDPQCDVARVRAKQLMALHFQGRADHASEQLAAYVARHRTAEGILGGRNGKYADLLSELFARPESGDYAEPDWSTFGGDPSRGRVQLAPPRLFDRLGILCRGGPTWRVSLPSLRPSEQTPDPPETALQRADYSRSLTFHPLIVGDRLFAADATRVVAFDLRRTGSREIDLYHLGFSSPPPQPGQRYTLTVSEGCLYARIGQPRVDEKTAAGTGAESKAFENRIVCLRLEPAPGEERVRWVERGLSGTNNRKRGRVIFEGTPVVRDGLVYVAATRFEADRKVTEVLCYAAEPSARAENRTEPPEPGLRWHTDVCEVREADGAPRYRHHLLTLAGAMVICCTRAGEVVALDSDTGRPAWASHCKARARTYEAKSPVSDQAPCVYANGRVYAVPGEGGDLLCLDADTGRTVWHRQATDVVHLLGVGAGRVIFATSTGLRAVDADNGGDQNGWSHEARTDYGRDGNRVGWAPAGRGFLAGEYVFWPAIDDAGGMAVHVLRQDSGEPDDNPTLLHQLPVGNLVFADGCLAVAGRDELAVFVPPAWQLPERERGVQSNPDSAKAFLALARSEGDCTLLERAAASYRRTEELAGRDRRIREQARRERQRLCLDTGRQAAESQRWQEAKRAFGLAAASEFSPAERAAAVMEAAEVWHHTDRLADRAAAFHTILDDDELAEAVLPRWATAGRLASLCLDNPELPFFTERQQIASAALAKAKDSAGLERVARRFAYTEASRTALERLARGEEQANHPGAAADYWRRLFVMARGEPPPSALAGLARNCERQGCAFAARKYWECLARTEGDSIDPDVDSSGPVRKAVAEHLRTLPVEPPSVSFPLRAAWDLALDPDEELLPLPGSDVFVTTGGASSPFLVCRDVATGKKRWRVSLPFLPSKAFSHDDLILVAGCTGVVALRREDGVRSWSFQPPEKDRTEPLTGFRFFSGRLFCFHGGRLVSFCADSGELWRVRDPDAGLHSRARLGRFVRHIAPVGDQVLVQTSAGKRVAYGTDVGNRTRDFPAAEPWTSDPVPVGNEVVTVEGKRRVSLLSDCERWTYTVPGVTTLASEPARVTVVGDALLLLVQTNIGYQLQRLDRASGRPLWPLPALLEEPLADPSDWTAGDGSVCLVEGGILIARSLVGGRRVWETPAGDSGRTWHVERLPGGMSGGLLAYPTVATARHFEFRWLTGRLQWNVVPDTGESVGHGFPLVRCDMAGRVVQRLNLGAGGSALRTDHRFFANDLVAPRAAAWRGTAGECPPVQVSARGVLVVVGPRAWGLAPAGGK